MRISAPIFVSAILALTACTAKTDAPSPKPTASAPTDYLAKIDALSPGLRNTTLYRAIVDAGFDCQGVTESAHRAPVVGLPAWTARCTNGRQWVLVLEPNGIIQVATPQQIAGAAK